MSEAATPLSSAGAVRPPTDHLTAQWNHACLAATMLAIAPWQLAGIHVRAGAGPVRDFWLEATLDLFDPVASVRRMPPTIDDDRLIGGLDLTATLARGRPVMQNGLLADCDGGVLLVPMAERLARANAAAIASVIDQGRVHLERGGVSRQIETRFATILFDESGPEMETPPQILRDRLAMQISLDGLSVHDIMPFTVNREDIAGLRAGLTAISLEEETLCALSAGLLAAGIGSLRTLHQASLMARCHAGLHGRKVVAPPDALAALSLAIGIPLTISAPATDEEGPVEAPTEDAQTAPTSGEEQPPQASSPDSLEDTSQTDNQPPDPLSDTDEAALEDMLVAAVTGLNMAGTFEALQETKTHSPATGDRGVAGLAVKSRQRGRVVGVRPGDPRRDGRLDVLATIRAAAPWQRLRQQAEENDHPHHIAIRRGDFHVKTYETNSQTVVIFVVDASGSAAFHRMAEAKGAVEHLLADCYARRDQVAMIAFRHQGADLLLPPTRSLVRAQRALAHLPGGGGTPLAAGLHSALVLALAERAKGSSPYLVVLSDGRGNIALDGTPGREMAHGDAERCARRIKAAQVPTLFFDISARGGAQAASSLAASMGAVLKPLPRAGAGTGQSVISQSVRTLTEERGAA